VTVVCSSELADDTRRARLFAGELLVLPPCPASLALCAHARAFLDEAFAPFTPPEAQHHLSVEEFVARFAPAKPAFIHDLRTRELVREVLAQVGCDLDRTYQDVPRLRGVTGGGYLTAGVGYAHPPHRDTWFSAPLAQLNWWSPLYEFSSEQGMAFHPEYWDRPVRNGSADFDYGEWNAVGRPAAASQIHQDTRKQPLATEPVALEPDVRIVCPVGGLIVFSAAQLHSAVPNTTAHTRYSIDFRTVHIDDLRLGRGAPNLDSHPTGTSLPDFVRASDASPLPAALVAAYDRPRPPQSTPPNVL
jgi:hypothetical protein